MLEVHVICASASSLLDVDPRFSSYQNTSASYAEIIAEAYGREKDALVVADNRADITIQMPIFQYRETAWAFTLRMAGQLGMHVSADYRVLYPAVNLGKKEMQSIELNGADYTVGSTTQNGYFYSFETQQQLNLGDSVISRGKHLIVVEKHSVFSDGAFVDSYTLGTAQGYSVKPYNLSLAGLRLKGTVLAVQGKKLKMHMDIDASQNQEQTFWFDFVPQSGNVMYCMPQVGTKVMLRFCSDLDSSAVIEDCWRENGQACADFKDYNKRYFTSEFGKQMAMLPELFSFKGSGNRTELSDRSGIVLQTSQYTQILSEQDIYISAKRRVSLKTPRHIYITKPNTQSVIDFAGNEINIDSVDTNITTTPEMVFNKPYSAYEVEPVVSINRKLAATVLAFSPKNSGKSK